MNDRGSIFIEAIVATAILALILGATFEVLRDSAQRAQRAERQRTALMIAQSRLATFDLTRPVSPGLSRGIADPYRWEVAIRPLGRQRGAFDTAGLMQVEVVVRHREGRGGAVRLATVRQGRS